MVGQQVLLSEHVGPVLVLTMNRPESRNALDALLRTALHEAVAAADQDPEVRAIVLTGTDPAFCAGVDLRELRDQARHEPIGPRTAPFLTSATPLIGAINGAAYTGGLELALSCHFLLASQRARFADTHARFGLTPGWGATVLLPDAVGSRRARQLLTSGEPISADTAMAWGLINEVVSHEQLVDRAVAIGESIARSDATAVHVLSTLFDERAMERDQGAWQREASAFLGDRIRPDAHG